jgi:hypothetical protein
MNPADTTQPPATSPAQQDPPSPSGHKTAATRDRSRWVLLAFGGIVLMGLAAIAMACSNGSRDRTAGPNAGVTSPATQGSTPVLRAITGTAPPLLRPSTNWSGYQNAAIGLTLRYPSEWTLVESPQQFGVSLYPPESSPDRPSPMIALDFAPQRAYGTQPITSQFITQPEPISVGGVTGRKYEDAEFAVPLQNSYIELPHRGGLLLITATKGPNTNLVPQLEEILKGLTLQN